MASEQTDIVSGFILDAPPGELQDVLADVKNLVSDTDVTEELAPAIEQYNKEQLVTVTLPGGSQRVIISEFNELSDGRYFDPSASSSWAFDHATQKASSVQSYVLESEHADLIKSTLRSLSTHATEHYPSLPASTVLPPSDASPDALTILIVGNKYSPANFWNGRWRSVFHYNPSTSTLSGTIKVDVHYYEDGNVRLLTTKPVEDVKVGATGGDIVREIAKVEKAYQEELNKAFGQLSEGAFKGLRRQLPITRQKIDWEKIGSYRLGQDIGGARAGR